MRHKSRAIIALILSPFVFSFAFGMDIYVPVIPEIRQIFHTSQFLVQLTLSLFILGIGIGNIFLGPISDQFGRLRVILISAFLFIIGALCCGAAQSIGFLIAARLVCAIGACGMLIVAFAIVRDIFSGDDSAQLYSWLNAAIGISPTFAPILGGYIALIWHWRAVFWFLAFLGLLVLLNSVFFIRETLPVAKRQRFNRQAFARYKIIFSNPTFLRYMLFAAAGVTICFSFFSVSPFIIMKLLHVKQQMFGYYFAIFGLSITIGGIIAGKVVARYGVDTTIIIGLIMICLGGFLMLLANLIFGLHLMLFMSTVFISSVGAIFCLGSGAAGAMEPFPEYAGTAAASLQAGQFVIAAVIGTILMRFPIHSSIPFAICVLLVGACSCMLLFIKKV